MRCSFFTVYFHEYRVQRHTIVDLKGIFMDELPSSTPLRSADNYQMVRIRRYAWYFTATWTVLLLSSAVLSFRNQQETLINIVKAEARAAISRDLMYRRWGSSHGGVYAPITVNNPPNPYLSHIPERDIVTPSGRKLTLINPAYMTRQVFELAAQNDVSIGSGHLTSLNPLRPQNAPDPWERDILISFEKGVREASEMVQVGGKPFMRLMQAFITEKSCLKCHEAQGYKVGDVRGAISVRIPAQPLFDASRNQTVASLMTHGVVWLLGLGMTFLGARKLTRAAETQKQVETELQEQALRLEEEISDRQAIQESLQENEEKLQEINIELRATEEVLRNQLGQYEFSQAQLRESNANLQVVFNVSPLPIIISSFDSGVIRDINRTFTDVFGYEQKDAIGKTGFDLGIWNDISERNYFIRVFSEKRGDSFFPAEIKNIHGEVRSIRMYCNDIEFNDEKCLLIVLMDITDQKKTEEVLRQSQKMDVVGQLAGGIAHDFNNMLTAILGSAEMMERYVKDNPAQAKLLATIQEAAGRSADLTGQLLAFSRKGSTMSVQVRLNMTIQSVIGMLEHSIDKNILLETRLTADNDLVIGDPTQLQNALLNLGLNARDAMPDGGVITYSTATVFLDSAYCESHGSRIKPGNYLEISVSDTGTGMTKDVLEHVFEPFFTTKELGKGTGLGLASVYGTLNEHLGCINVYSEVGLGTVFKLYIPLVTDQPSSSSTEEVIPCGSGGILLVDDEQLICEIGQALLEEHGYTVFLARDGRQALEVYEREREHISLVIMDVVMPVMGGKEALQHLVAAYPDVKVLISSGFQQNETIDSFVALGAAGFIQKPYRTHELLHAVNVILQSAA